MSKCKTVTLRKRKIKNGTQYSVCLDYYPGYRDNVTMRVITREALGIYIFAKPANQQERDFNARMMKKAVIHPHQPKAAHQLRSRLLVNFPCRAAHRLP